jgi:ATP-dependent helicase YprA (DUF1998 family)
VAEADPRLNARPTPLDITARLRSRVTEAVIAQAGIRHDQLNAFLRKQLAGTSIERGALFAEPSLEGAASYVSSGKTPADLSGTLLHPKLVAALAGNPGDDYRFVQPAYAHQLEAWNHLLATDRRSVLVSSGTGSGKTECFLVPLLQDLAAEAEASGRLRGVRALMLYPLNALIASQEERLRRWTAPFGGDIRFGLYNGMMQDRRKHDRDRDERLRPEQVLYRSTLRDDPPPILVTNNTMLEYMTIRREDRGILEASRGLLRWIVIDEAHSYIGSAAAEVSLLLRRVLQAFEVAPGQVRFVATSATIGGSDDQARLDLRRYLADLAGVPEVQVHVVIGHRQPVDLPRAAASSSLDANTLSSPSLAAHPTVQAAVRDLEAGPVSLSAIGRLAAGSDCEPQDLLHALASPRAAIGSAEAPLLPLRVHNFIRALPGLWSCLNPGCSGDRPDDWPFGGILFERQERCLHCASPAFEIVSCRECGEPWLQAFDAGTQLTPLATAPDRDEFASASAREMDGDDEEDGEAEAGVSGRPLDGVRRFLATRPLEGLIELSVEPATGILPERRADGMPVRASRVGTDDRCPRCNAAAQTGSPGPIWPFRFGAPFLIQNAAPTMLEAVAPAEAEGVELPAEGRRLLSFTDSRQGTARFAANIETMAERGFVRAFVYHAVQKAATVQTVDPETRSRLEERLAKLKPLAGDPTFDDMIRDAELELAGTDTAPAGVPWTDAVRNLAAEPMVKQWIGAVWDDDRDERFHRDREALANYLLLRELARRPRRANAVETLGFAKLVFPQIEKLTEARVPEELRRRGRSIEEWRAFLYFLVDSLRNQFALNISRSDARWLLPRRAFLRSVVGPGQERRIPSDLVWPRAPAGAGVKSNAVLLLEHGLQLDSANPGDRAEMDNILRKAWDQLLPLLQGSGSTLSLNLDRASLAAVGHAWICPVTHRVLPRLVFGRSPYTLRGAGASAGPAEPIAMASLPTTFPQDEAARAQLLDFVTSSEAIGDLRSRGVWGDLNDRAATFAPFIRAEEHSAQQPPHRLRAFEEEFKRGEINLLACSTTMEMGVDIGSVEAVLNTNVPPSIANYRQRVGRAGRRGQGFSSSLTFARDTPLDREAFRDPVAYLKRGLRSPQVKLDSARIVQRHVNAMLLARWFRDADGQLAKARSGDFFGFPQGLGLDPDPEPPVAEFRAWLLDPSTGVATKEKVAELVRGTALEGVPGLLTTAADMFGAATEDFGRQWRALREQAHSVAKEARTGIEIMVRRMCREFLLRELGNRSLLPGHGFPTAVLPFITDCAEVRDRQRRRDDEEGGETSRNRRYDYPSRNADIAIREYAPGAEIVVDGLVWESAGVTLNWERPAHDEGAREIQSIRWSWLCRDCGESGCDRQMTQQCSACGSSSLALEQFLEPAGFRVDWSCRPHAETDRVRFIEPQPPRVSARNARWEPMLDPTIGRCRATGEGMVFHHSLGAGGAGYRVCLDCGRAADESDGSLAEHVALMPAKGASGRCAGNDKPFAITRPLALAHEVLTDVAELQPSSLTSLGGAWALASAIREALSRRLGIETRELGLAIDRRPSPLGGATHSMFFYDQASGGAGYAPRLLDDLVAVLSAARHILDCVEDCVRGCSSCVLVADLYAQQEIIDRRAALDYVAGLLQAMAEPEPEDIAFPGAVLSPPVADALARRVRANNQIAIYAQEAFDIAALAEQPFTALFSSAARARASAALVIPRAVLAALDDAQRIGLRNAAQRHDFILLRGEPFEAQNGARLIASIKHGGGTELFASRDRDAAHIGPTWGVGSEHPAVRSDTALPFALEAVGQDELERPLRPGDKVRIIAADPGRPAKQFGAGLIGRILKQDLDAAGLWKPGRLKALSYSDRYLKAPLPVMLMMRTMAALRDALAAAGGAPLQLSIRTDRLKEDRYGGAPSRLAHNWRDEDDRKDTIIELARRFGLDCRFNDKEAPHGRKLTIDYDDGSSAILLLDQGFGYWRARSGDQHNFRAGPIEQARALADSHVFVAGLGESYVAVTRA